MKTISSWLLGGALAASMTWNWKLVSDADGLPSCASGSDCAPASCTLASSEIDLDPAQRTALDLLCARSCNESDRLERRAEELRAELLASLAGERVDAAATEKLVNEISDLRRRSLAACVEGILGVRDVLDGEQVRALLECCEPGSCR